MKKVNEYIESGELQSIKEEVILSYLLNERKLDINKAMKNLKKMREFPDIMNEFYGVVISNKFNRDTPVTVNGMTAEYLTNNTFLSVLGAYNYLMCIKQN